MERYMLSDGYEMPKIGLETFQMKPEEAEAAAASTLAAGYRHIDTANICMNERAVGRAIKRSGIDRNEIFVPSKLWPSVCRAGAEAIDATHSRLDTDYLDMLILHQPAGGYVRAWKAMEDAYAQGKIRTLGLSNFSEKQIQKVLASAHVMPQLVASSAIPAISSASSEATSKPTASSSRPGIRWGMETGGFWRSLYSCAWQIDMARRLPRQFYAGTCRWALPSSPARRILPILSRMPIYSISRFPPSRWQR